MGRTEVIGMKRMEVKWTGETDGEVKKEEGKEEE
jgi:hypothetical protein